MTAVPASLSARRGALYMSAAAAAWGTGGAAGSLLFQTAGLGPAGVSLWRYALGALFLLGILRLTGGSLPRLSARVVVVGAGMAVYQAAYFAAIERSGVAVATVVTMGATPVITELGGRLLLGERSGRTGLLALAAALAGLFLLTGESVLAGGGRLGGVGFALLSAAGYAAVTLYSRRHRDDSGAMAVGGFVVGALCLTPFALVGGAVPEPSLTTAALLLYLGAVPTALAYALFFRALTTLRAATVSVISLGEAVFAAVLGVLLFGERLSVLGWAGCALLTVAVVLPAVRPEQR
ncbi:DMT family transporter [Nonomuraea rhodomycinica]|uniref:EamA family transporter n=1 Tax=Nonomuraea rhodomycinica TaxID=1712872 RepID=A0A7Y6IQQ8_9ACTN|nr:EamA family transporter [Nonomuraea rhodomycinica]NUW42355.1 EamA family transporter [Nonomuraea rhodomycinica]